MIERQRRALRARRRRGDGGGRLGDAFTDSHAVHRGQPVAMLGLKLDFLTTGCRYDLKRREGIAPPAMLHLEPVDRRAPERPPVLTEEVSGRARRTAANRKRIAGSTPLLPTRAAHGTDHGSHHQETSSETIAS